MVLVKERQDIVVEHMGGGHRQLVGIEPSPGVPGMAVQNRLQVDLADPFQGPDEEGVHGHQLPCEPGPDMPFPELRAEPFQKADLLLGQFDLLLPKHLFQPQEPVLHGCQAVPAPDSLDPAGTDGHPFEGQFLSDS